MRKMTCENTPSASQSLDVQGAVFCYSEKRVMWADENSAARTYRPASAGSCGTVFVGFAASVLNMNSCSNLESVSMMPV